MKALYKSVYQKVHHFDLIREIAINDFKIKYQNSVLGYFWSLARPLFLFAILYVVFSKVLRFGGQIPNFPVYLITGVVFWSYFAESTSTAMHSVVGKGSLIRKVYFPREVIIIASSITSTLTFLLNLLIVFVFVIFSGIPITINALWLIPIVIEFYIFVLAMSFLLSALFVKFRDVGHLWEVILQGLFYATPIFYSLAFVPERFRPFVMTSPIAQVIQSARKTLISGEIQNSFDVLSGFMVLLPFLIIITLLIAGILYFRKSAASFAEDV